MRGCSLHNLVHKLVMKSFELQHNFQVTVKTPNQLFCVIQYTNASAVTVQVINLQTLDCSKYEPRNWFFCPLVSNRRKLAAGIKKTLVFKLLLMSSILLPWFFQVYGKIKVGKVQCVIRKVTSSSGNEKQQQASRQSSVIAPFFCLVFLLLFSCFSSSAQE